jgi:beta-N-acetylhexosaminidase
MEGASGAGGVIGRANAALAAGCDMVVVCNDPSAVDALLAGLEYAIPAVSLMRLARIHGWPAASGNMVKLREDPHYMEALRAMAGIGTASGDLPLVG